MGDKLNKMIMGGFPQLFACCFEVKLQLQITVFENCSHYAVITFDFSITSYNPALSQLFYVCILKHARYIRQTIRYAVRTHPPSINTVVSPHNGCSSM